MIKLVINLVDKTGPILSQEVKINETNSATVTISSNKELKNDKPTWKIANDNLSMSKTFLANQDYFTTFSDKFGNKTNYNIKFSDIKIPYQVDYTYDSTNHSMLVTVSTTSKFSKTKPTWNLSDDGKTYTKTFFENNSYFTKFTDIYGNSEDIEINFNLTE